MLDRLHEAGLATTKLTTHDGPIDTLPPSDRRFDLAFIDGEHTDQACFRDFLWALPMMKTDSAIMFHDSSLIYKAIRLIGLLLRKDDRPFAFLKNHDSEMSAIFLGDFSRCHLGRYFETGEDRDDFFAASELSVLEHNIRNRVRSGPGEERLNFCHHRSAKVGKSLLLTSGISAPSQILRQSGQVAASASRPITPVIAVASGAPMRSASQPSQTKPIGPVPMQTESTPRMRERISIGAAR